MRYVDTSTSGPDDRTTTVEQVRKLCPYLHEDDRHLSPIRGGMAAARQRLNQIDPQAYGRTRNHLDGAVTELSPFIRHGVLSLAHVRDAVLDKVDHRNGAEKLVQQLTWREYWQRLYTDLGDAIWEDQEPYKTGFGPDDYADDLPEDISAGETGVAAIDQMLRELIETGWIHNHARLYVAAYVCHFRRVKWQAGAQFFLTHLLDGDPASNNLSWQWVASTFSHKPYFFNLDNLKRFAGPDLDVSAQRNAVLNASYETLHLRLFPNLDPPVPQSSNKTKARS